MKRIYNLTLVVLIGFFTGGTLTSCVSDDTLSLKDEEQQSMPEGMLTINYKIGFPDEVSTTYAGGTTMIQTAAECKINNIHALFFYPAKRTDHCRFLLFPESARLCRYKGHRHCGCTQSG